MDALSGIGLRPRLPVTLADFADPSKREDWARNRNMLVFQLWDPANAERSVDVFVREPLDFRSHAGRCCDQATRRRAESRWHPWCI